MHNEAYLYNNNVTFRNFRKINDINLYSVCTTELGAKNLSLLSPKNQMFSTVLFRGRTISFLGGCFFCEKNVQQKWKINSLLSFLWGKNNLFFCWTSEKKLFAFHQV